MYTNDYDGDDDYIDEWNPSSSDQVSWYGSDYEQQDHDLDILDKLREDTQELIERQNNSTLLKRKNEKYSQDLITSLKNERYLVKNMNQKKIIYLYIYIFSFFLSFFLSFFILFFFFFFFFFFFYFFFFFFYIFFI